MGVKGCGSGIGREERATDGEVDGGGVFRGEGGEDEVDFGGGGEGRVEVDGGGGVEASLGAEVMGDEAGEVVVSAVAKRAGAAGDLVVAVAVGGVEGMVGGDGFSVRTGTPLFLGCGNATTRPRPHGYGASGLIVDG